LVERFFRTQWGTLGVAILLACVVVAIVSPAFGSVYNIYVILQATSTVAVIGLAQMVVLGVGDMNLALGGVGSVATVIVGALTQDHGVPALPAALVAVAVGTAAGVLNGLIVTRSGLAAFIVTLATGGAFTGIALGITQSKPYPNVSSDLIDLGQDRFGLLPVVAVVPVCLAIGLAAFFRWLPAGRAILAVGGNREAAELSGVSSRRARISAHAISGAFGAIAATMYVGVLGTASPAVGSDWLLTSFAVPIIGGTALMGGRVSVPGCLVGALLLAAISNALISLNVSQYAVMFTEGVLVFLAVFIGSARSSRSRRAGSRPVEASVVGRVAEGLAEAEAEAASGAAAGVQAEEAGGSGHGAYSR
jgi:ribose transport system permease protein